MDNAPAAAWDKLSESLPYGRTPGFCQACGQRGKAQLWDECDMTDRETGVRLFLCQPCADKLIEPHPRAYTRIPDNAPIPGTMAICVACAHRIELTCGNPSAKANGGPGLNIKIPPASHGFVDYRDKKGKRVGKRVTIWPEPAKQCTGQV